MCVCVIEKERGRELCEIERGKEGDNYVCEREKKRGRKLCERERESESESESERIVCVYVCERVRESKDIKILNRRMWLEGVR